MVLKASPGEGNVGVIIHHVGLVEGFVTTPFDPGIVCSALFMMQFSVIVGCDRFSVDREVGLHFSVV